MSQRLATIESDVADIKHILSDIKTEVEDDGYRSLPDDDQQLPDFTGASSSCGNTSIIPLPLLSGPSPDGF